MSEETVAIENEEPEMDVISLLASQGEDTDDYEDDELEESSVTGDLPDDPEELKKLYLESQERLNKKLKFLKNSKKANHRIQNEMNELKDAFDAFKEQSSTSQPVDSGAKDQEYKEALEQWRESVADDPSKAVDFAAWQSSNTQTQMVDYIAKMQSQFEAKIAELNGKTDPERIKYRQKIDSLRANPEFADIPEETLIKFIRATEKIKKPRGGISGQKVTTTANSVEEQIKAATEKYNEYYKNGV